MTTMSSEHERFLSIFIKKAQARGHKKYKKNDFLRLLVETAMSKEKMDINAPNHIDRKIQEKILSMRRMEKKNGGETRRPMLVNPSQSKKPRFSISCQPPLIEKEACNFKEDEKKKGVLISNNVEDGDYDYEKEVMKKKKMKIKKCSSSSSDDKNYKNKKSSPPLPPPPPPSEDICKLMLERISEVGGADPVWLNSKDMERSDVNNKLGRLFIPKSDALLNFLTKEEMKIVKSGIPCRVVDQNGVRWDLLFKYWDCVKQYIFICGWKNVVNGFELTDENPGKIELWCFRLPRENSNLCFGMRITR